MAVAATVEICTMATMAITAITGTMADITATTSTTAKTDRDTIITGVAATVVVTTTTARTTMASEIDEEVAMIGGWVGQAVPITDLVEAEAAAEWAAAGVVVTVDHEAVVTAAMAEAGDEFQLIGSWLYYLIVPQ